MDRPLTDQEQEKLERDFDSELVRQLEQTVDEHADVVKHILHALVAAAVPISCATAAALQELGVRMGSLIHSIMDEDEPSG